MYGHVVGEMAAVTETALTVIGELTLVGVCALRCDFGNFKFHIPVKISVSSNQLMHILVFIKKHIKII